VGSCYAESKCSAARALDGAWNEGKDDRRGLRSSTSGAAFDLRRHFKRTYSGAIKRAGPAVRHTTAPTDANPVRSRRQDNRTARIRNSATTHTRSRSSVPGLLGLQRPLGGGALRPGFRQRWATRSVCRA